MAILFSADLHFGHGNIITYCNRPFTSVAEMNEGLVSRWNAKVKPNDIVYFIGDFSFMSEIETLEILLRLNGRIRIIPGNHDRKILKSVALQRQFDAVLPELYEEKINGTSVVMCHYPMMSWNKAHHGSNHLHGHSHGMIPFDPKFRRLDVGADVHNCEPISWDEVVNFMKTVTQP